MIRDETPARVASVRRVKQKRPMRCPRLPARLDRSAFRRRFWALVRPARPRRLIEPGVNRGLSLLVRTRLTGRPMPGGITFIPPAVTYVAIRFIGQRLASNSAAIGPARKTSAGAIAA
jgi:hypothetical protein